MCLLVVASRLDPDEPLIVGANRDEVVDRPATSMTVLAAAGPRVLGGRDELSGGTWLAVNEHGVCAGLTNQPLVGAKDLTRRSRGELPLALARHASAPAAVEAFVAGYRPAEFNGAWLLVGDRTSLFFVDFTREAGAASAVPLGPGIHVLENRPITVPSRKVSLVRDALGHPNDGDEVVDAFRRVLVDHQLPEGEDHPNAANCVHREGFATRSSCIVRVPADRRPRLWVADGPPCVTPYREVTELWEADRPSDGAAPAPETGPPAHSRTIGL